MPGPVEVFMDETPNPDAIKLTLNRLVSAQGATYRGDPAAAAAPWAKALLSIPGVLGVYGVNAFISVSKAPEANWDDILPAAEAALKTVFAEKEEGSKGVGG